MRWRSWFLRLSTFNRLIVLALAVTGVGVAIDGRTVLAGIILVSSAITVVGVLLPMGTRRPDLERVAAVQPADEREERISNAGFAFVGMVAVIYATISLLLFSADLHIPGDTAIGRFALLMTVWTGATLWAARRA